MAGKYRVLGTLRHQCGETSMTTTQPCATARPLQDRIKSPRRLSRPAKILPLVLDPPASQLVRIIPDGVSSRAHCNFLGASGYA